MLIEICGPDGSGKSTLTDALLRRLNADPRSAAYERVIRSEGWNVLEGLRLAGHDPFAVREIELVVVLDFLRESLSRLTLFQRDPHQHVVVNHHACLLGARLIRAGLSDDAALWSLLTRLPIPDVSIRLEVEPGVALERLRSRRRGDQLLGLDDPTSAIEAISASFRVADDRLPYSPIVLSGAAPPDELAESAWGHIKPIVAR